MNTATKRITEGAMMVAIVGLMLFINRQFGGLLEYAFYWVLSFPILIYAARYGFRASFIPGVSMLLLSLMLAAPTTIFYLFSCIVIGIAYGGGVYNKWKNGKLLIVMAFFTLLSLLTTTVFMASIFGFDPKDDIEMVITLMKYLNINTGSNMGSMVMVIVLVSASLMTILQTICIHIISNSILDRLQIACHPMKGFMEIQLPRFLGIIIIIIWMLFLVRNMVELNQDVLSAIIGVYSLAKAIALGYGVMALFAIAGYLRKRIAILFVLIGVCIPYVQGFIACIGTVELLFRFRDRIRMNGIRNEV